MDVEQPTIVHVHYPHHDPPHTDEPKYRLRLRELAPKVPMHSAHFDAAKLAQAADLIRQQERDSALAEARLKASQELVRQMAPPVPSVADQLATITNGNLTLHMAPIPAPPTVSVGTGAPPGPPPPPPPPAAVAKAAPLAAPPVFAGAASSSAAPGVSAERRATPDDLPAKVQRVGTPSPERRAKEAAKAEAARAEAATEALRKAEKEAAQARAAAARAEEREKESEQRAAKKTKEAEERARRAESEARKARAEVAPKAKARPRSSTPAPPGTPDTGRSRSREREAASRAVDEIMRNVPPELIEEQLQTIAAAMKKAQGSHSSRSPSGDRTAFAAASRIPYVQQV